MKYPALLQQTAERRRVFYPRRRPSLSCLVWEALISFLFCCFSPTSLPIPVHPFKKKAGHEQERKNIKDDRLERPVTLFLRHFENLKKKTKQNVVLLALVVGRENKIFFKDKTREKLLKISLVQGVYRVPRLPKLVFFSPTHHPSVVFYIGKIDVARFHRQGIIQNGRSRVGETRWAGAGGSQSSSQQTTVSVQGEHPP